MPSTALRPSRQSVGPVVFVGAGPGDPGLLTRRGAELLARAAVVVADEMALLGDIVDLTSPTARLVDLAHGSAEDGDEVTTAGRAKRLVQLAGAVRPGQVLVRLVDGDPSFFGGFAEEASALAHAGIGFDVVPGVTAVSAVPAYAGVPLVSTQPGSPSYGVYVVSITGSYTPDWRPSLVEEVTTVVLGLPERLGAALGELLDAGKDPNTPVGLTQDGTTGRQSTTVTTLGAAQSVFASTHAPIFPTLAVIGPTVALRERLSWFETRPMHGWRVLVPQTKDHPPELVARLSDYGAESTVVRTIGIEPPRTPHAMDRAVTGLVTGRYEWVGFTSAHAVRAVRERLACVGLDARALAGLKVAAAGPEVVAALHSWGIEPDLVGTSEGGAVGLLDAWPDYDDVLDPINRVFLPRADIATDTLAAGLLELGWEVDDVTAYRTVRAAPPPAPVREAIKGGDFDAVVFASSSTVRNLVGIAGKPPASTIVACIGPRTAQTAEELGLRVDVIPTEATPSALVDALAAHAADLIERAGRAARPSLVRAARRRST